MDSPSRWSVRTITTSFIGPACVAFLLGSRLSDDHRAGFMGVLTSVVIYGFRLRSRGLDPPPWQVLAPGLMLLSLQILAFQWYHATSVTTPRPYLDEVFHVPQAQKYCVGKYYEWDDKITTPPGLYLVSRALGGLLRLPSCSAIRLRWDNFLAIVLAFLAAAACRSLQEARLAQTHGRPRAQPFSLYALHTGFNVALFPVLFFFSGLYYTDVWSTLAVLLSHLNHLRRLAPGGGSVLNDHLTIVLGVFALLMRQTNIFWVVVFQGGVEAVHAVKTLHPPVEEAPRLGTLAEVARYYAWRYSIGDVHDPPMSVAWLDDWAFSVLSIAVAVLCNPVRVLKQVWPHVALMGLFGGFVLWNGGVVLGDKSNHVATIHLAQMLYIWPFFAFFSAPLLLSTVTPFLGMASRTFSRLSGLLFGRSGTQAGPSGAAGSGSSASASLPSHYRRDPKKSNKPHDPAPSYLLRAVGFVLGTKVFYLPYVLGTLAASLLVVRYNTIVHPFTLADNRHYMFYVFRYTIRRPGRARYYLVAAYTLCRWAVWACLSGGTQLRRPAPAQPGARRTRYLCRPFADPETRRSAADVERIRKEEEGAAREEGAAADEQAAAGAGEKGREGEGNGGDPPQSLPDIGLLDAAHSASDLAPTASTGLVWLVATALSLVTAPLVEPRYFILPWVFWRLLVPARPGLVPAGPRVPAWLARLSGAVDLRLALETAWFLAVNAATMYVFVTRPFVWQVEGGRVLDGGRLQRFMW